MQPPQRARFAGHVPWTLDEAAARAVAALYVGRHDFASLASSGSSAVTTVRSVTRSEAAFDAGTLVYEVEADGFLRKMVRSMVGGLIAAGSGAMGIEPSSPRRSPPATAAPGRGPREARGLTLVRVDYPPESGRS